LLHNLLRLLSALVLLGLVLAALSVPRQASAEPATPTILDPPGHVLLKQIRRYKRQTWKWQRLMGVRRTRAGNYTRVKNLAYRSWVRDVWHRRAVRTWKRAQRPPRKNAWLCIHRYERNPRQGWRTHTGNGYYGGLQMDMTFQRTYGHDLLRRKGTANRWSALEQMWVAERAYRSGRGFHPWPNTARACGLI
jgi:Transglycosylase-like domain